MKTSELLLLTLEQAAIVFEVSAWTIRALVRAGTLPHRYLGKGKNKLRFDAAELSEYFNRHEGGSLL